MKLSVEEIKAVAESAIGARQTATAAKTALEADPENPDLISALEDAESLAKDAEAKALALSQDAPPVDHDKEKKKSKLLRKKGYIEKELRDLGVDSDDEDEDDDEDSEDPNRPLTVAEFERRTSAKSINEMVNSIEDEDDKKAVQTALKRVVPSGDPIEDFRSASAIANVERNSKILEEHARGTAVTRIHAPTRTGGGPRIVEAFVPTAEEKTYMGAPFFLSQADIVKARGSKA